MIAMNDRMDTTQALGGSAPEEPLRLDQASGLREAPLNRSKYSRTLSNIELKPFR
jgi:hypothetical protein